MLSYWTHEVSYEKKKMVLLVVVVMVSLVGMSEAQKCPYLANNIDASSAQGCPLGSTIPSHGTWLWCSSTYLTLSRPEHHLPSLSLSLPDAHMTPLLQTYPC
jgi:hypothetical protein